jgi:hypothetical protein
MVAKFNNELHGYSDTESSLNLLFAVQ